MNGDTMRWLDSGAWSEQNPNTCPCHGNGWLLSDGDTWHRCRVHGAGVPHPEDAETPFDYEEHKRAMFQDAFKLFTREAQHLGFMGDFEEACRRRLIVVFTQEGALPALVEMAEQIVGELRAKKADEAALAQGYSCALEADLAWEAEKERDERGF